MLDQVASSCAEQRPNTTVITSATHDRGEVHRNALHQLQTNSQQAAFGHARQTQSGPLRTAANSSPPSHPVGMQENVFGPSGSGLATDFAGISRPLCLSCRYPIESERTLFGVVSRFQDMLRFVGYSITELLMRSEYDGRVTLKLDLLTEDDLDHPAIGCKRQGEDISGGNMRKRQAIAACRLCASACSVSDCDARDCNHRAVESSPAQPEIQTSRAEVELSQPGLHNRCHEETIATEVVVQTSSPLNVQADITRVQNIRPEAPPGGPVPHTDYSNSVGHSSGAMYIPQVQPQLPLASRLVQHAGSSFQEQRQEQNESGRHCHSRHHHHHHHHTHHAQLNLEKPGLDKRFENESNRVTHGVPHSSKQKGGPIQSEGTSCVPRTEVDLSTGLQEIADGEWNNQHIAPVAAHDSRLEESHHGAGREYASGSKNRDLEGQQQIHKTALPTRPENQKAAASRVVGEHAEQHPELVSGEEVGPTLRHQAHGMGLHMLTKPNSAAASSQQQSDEEQAQHVRLQQRAFRRYVVQEGYAQRIQSSLSHEQRHHTEAEREHEADAFGQDCGNMSDLEFQRRNSTVRIGHRNDQGREVLTGGDEAQRKGRNDQRSAMPEHSRLSQMIGANLGERITRNPLAATISTIGTSSHDNLNASAGIAICQPCNAAFSTPLEHQRHIFKKHPSAPIRTSNGRFACMFECGQDFAREHVMRRHLQSVHLNLREFPCQSCDKSFGDQSTLTQHTTAVHLKQKPWVCTICNSCFTQSSSLGKHRRRLHPGATALSSSSGGKRTGGRSFPTDDVENGVVNRARKAGSASGGAVSDVEMHADKAQEDAVDTVVDADTALRESEHMQLETQKDGTEARLHTSNSESSRGNGSISERVTTRRRGANPEKGT